jgi:tyrosinase
LTNFQTYRYWDEQSDFELGPLQQASIFSADPITGFGSGIVDANNCTIDGAFADKLFDLTISLERVPPGQCLMRQLSQTQFELTSQPYVDACLAFEDFVSFSDCLGGDMQPHGGGHVAVGGTMGNPSLSPADPLFFMHHNNLDRLWWEWQLKDKSRLTAIGGPNVAHTGDSVAYQPASLPVSAFLPYFGDSGNETTLNHSLWTAGIRENVTIAEVLDLHGDRICADFEQVAGTGGARDAVKKLSSVMLFLNKIFPSSHGK